MSSSTICRRVSIIPPSSATTQREGGGPVDTCSSRSVVPDWSAWVLPSAQSLDLPLRGGNLRDRVRIIGHEPTNAHPEDGVRSASPHLGVHLCHSLLLKQSSLPLQPPPIAS